jgi:tRNA(Ile)-lysidine synthase
MLPKTPLAHYRLYEAGTQGTSSPSLDLQLIRPLLEVKRAEVEAYCRQHDLEPRFDRSNLDTTYYRNWLRHEVLPLLSKHNPNVQAVMRRSARVIAGEYALLRSLVADTWPEVVVEEVVDPSGVFPGRIVFDLAAWRALPVALQRSTLREGIHRLRRSLRNINFVHVENALQVANKGSTGDQATLPRGLALVVGYDRLTIAPAGSAEPLPAWPLLAQERAEIAVTAPGETNLPGSTWVLRAAFLHRTELPAGWDANDDPWLAYLDAHAVQGDLALRSRKPGDRFQPQGMGGHSVKLADFYTNQKVPRRPRDRLPLLVKAAAGLDADTIVWVCGWRVDERARVVGSTEQVLVARLVDLGRGAG